MSTNIGKEDISAKED